MQPATKAVCFQNDFFPADNKATMLLSVAIKTCHSKNSGHDMVPICVVISSDAVEFYILPAAVSIILEKAARWWWDTNKLI